MLGGAEEGKVRDCQGSTQARGMKSEGARWASPGNTLAGAAYIAPARALPGGLPHTSEAATLEPESSDTIDMVETKTQGRLRGGMQIFVKTKGL